MEVTVEILVAVVSAIGAIVGGAILYGFSMFTKRLIATVQAAENRMHNVSVMWQEELSEQSRRIERTEQENRQLLSENKELIIILTGQKKDIQKLKYDFYGEFKPRSRGKKEKKNA